MDLHADQIQGFFNVPVDHLYASGVFVDYMKSMNQENLVIATPDVGGTKRASAYAKFLGCPMVICYKIRKKANVISDMQIIGDVEGMDVLLVDDIVDTAGTMTKAAELMIRKGAVRGRCHHRDVGSRQRTDRKLLAQRDHLYRQYSLHKIAQQGKGAVGGRYVRKCHPEGM